jgi:hypothetical protein
MSDKGKIVIGLLILLILFLFPVLYSLAGGGKGAPPELVLPVGEKNCVESKDFMTSNHMNLLNEWRNSVVREGQQNYTSKAFGASYQMSLTGTCLGCHTDRETFCNRCHTYADVNPYCWNCHIDTKGVRIATKGVVSNGR